MDGSSGGRAVTGFGAAEMVAGRVAARARRGITHALMRRGRQRWGRGCGALGDGWSVAGVGVASGWELRCGGSDHGGFRRSGWWECGAVTPLNSGIR